MPKSRKRVVRKKFNNTPYYQGNAGKELKFFDTTLSTNFDTTITAFDTGALVNLIPQGDGESSRDGRKIVVRSIVLKGIWEYTPGASTAGTTVVSICLVLDKQANGSAPSATDIWSGTVLPRALLNLANSDRFVLLKRIDIPINVSAGVQTTFGSRTGVVNFYHKCSIPIMFNAGTGVIGEVRSNNLILFQGASREDDVANFNGTCRVRFDNAC